MGKIDQPHILIDASRSLSDQPTGIERYSTEIINSLLHEPRAKDLKFTLVAPKMPSKDNVLFNLPKNASWKIIPGKRAWTLASLSLAILRDKELYNSILFVPGHILPIFTPKHSILTIHDFAFRHFPESYPRLTRIRLNQELKRSANKADQIIVPSKSTAEDLKKYFKCPSDKINIIPHGININFFTNETNKNDLEKSKSNSKYFLVIGRLEERKNTLNILEAYEKAFAKETNPPGLIFVGYYGYGEDKISKKIKDLQDKQLPVEHKNYVTELELRQWLSNAMAMIYVSKYEGFGMPILEAMQAKVPVIASNTSSIPEVAGEAAILVNPHNAQQLSKAMLNISLDKKIRQKMIAEGIKQAAKFTWENAAAATLDVILKVNYKNDTKI